MATYLLNVPRISALQARSGVFTRDTLYASMGLRVMNAHGGLHMDYPAQSRGLGDWPGQDAQVIQGGLIYDSVDIPDPTADNPDGGAIYWSFLLVNGGAAGDKTNLLNAMNNAASGVAGALLGSGNPWAMLGGGALLGLQAVADILIGGCDGPLAGQTWALTAAQLAQMSPPSSSQGWLHEEVYKGTPGPFGCSESGSLYGVEYNIAVPATGDF